MFGNFAIGRSLTTDIWGNNYYFVVYDKVVDPFISATMLETGGQWERSLNSMFLHLWSSYGLESADDENIVVLDLGAAFGSFTLFAASLGARVWAFEMQYGSYALLEMSLRLSGYRNRVKLFKHAVWSRTGDSAFYFTSKTNPGAVFARTATQHNAHENSFDLEMRPVVWNSTTQYEVSTICLDDLSLARSDAPLKIFFMKMDVEGAEPYAIEGMRNLLSGRRIQHFTIEVRIHNTLILVQFFEMGYVCRVYDEEGYCHWPNIPCNCYARSYDDVERIFTERDPWKGRGYIDFHCSLDPFQVVDPLYPRDCDMAGVSIL
jgi:FkbM family methyltransferase